MSRIPRSIRVTFTREGIEFAVTYAHDGQQPTPGTRKRTATAATMARNGLELALEALGSGVVACGGFGTDTRVIKDTIIVDRKEHAA
jgi:hypothetical protein